jgi:hypothetical protein
LENQDANGNPVAVKVPEENPIVDPMAKFKNNAESVSYGA